MKLYTLTIPENIAPGRLFPWLRRMLPQLPEYAVREALDRRDVKLNGKRVDRQAMLIPGAEVRLYTPGEEIREPEIPILYEDSRVLVIRKPAGIELSEGRKGRTDHHRAGGAAASPAGTERTGTPFVPPAGQPDGRPSAAVPG